MNERSDRGLQIPTCDDKPIWDVWLSMLWLPAVTVADELEIFESLVREPATAAELAAGTGSSCAARTSCCRCSRR